MSDFMPQLPDLVVRKIFWHLNTWNLRIRAERVCRHWKIQSESLWKSNFTSIDNREFGIEPDKLMNSLVDIRARGIEFNKIGKLILVGNVRRTSDFTGGYPEVDLAAFQALLAKLYHMRVFVVLNVYFVNC